MPNEQEKFQETMEDLGRRLALLLAAADLPDDVKESWAVLIPEMSLEQIDRLTADQVRKRQSRFE